jgi:hypothetical protein
MKWCMKRTNIYLAEGQAAALDRIARAEGVSRAAIEGSFGVLDGEETFARARDKRMDYLDRLADA